MLSMANFRILNEVGAYHEERGWTLFLQHGVWEGDGDDYEGYRFIWRDENNNMLPFGGQSRLPSLKVTRRLIEIALSNGWGDLGNDESFNILQSQRRLFDE